MTPKPVKHYSQSPAHQRRIRKLTRLVQTLKGTTRLDAAHRAMIKSFADPLTDGRDRDSKSSRGGR